MMSCLRDQMMRALARDVGILRLREMPRPHVARPDDVVIRVVCAGLCRTDLYVAEGRLPVQEPRVLGHEFSGVVETVGPEVRHVMAGDRVAVMPFVGCGDCRLCTTGESTRCPSATMLGIDRDGAFAEAIVVPARAVYPMPDRLSYRRAAYAEPLAAALAVLRAGLLYPSRGLILGRNRIAQLTRRVLAADGFNDVTLWDPAVDSPVLSGIFDFAVETMATDAVFGVLLDAVRPGGTVVLKSRPARPVVLDVAAAVRREVTLRAVHYGSFAQAVAWLADGFEVDDLLGPVVPLEAFDRAFTTVHESEAKKVFFGLDGEAD
jgi:L-iditol 2-dehydrogenase